MLKQINAKKLIAAIMLVLSILPLLMSSAVAFGADANVLAQELEQITSEEADAGEYEPISIKAANDVAPIAEQAASGELCENGLPHIPGDILHTVVPPYSFCSVCGAKIYFASNRDILFVD